MCAGSMPEWPARVERLRFMFATVGTPPTRPPGSAAALAQPARYGWNAEDLNAIIIDWATDSGLVPDPTTPVAFLRWLLKRHDLAFSPTLLERLGAIWTAPQFRSGANVMRRSWPRSAQARATAQADLNGPGRRLARQVLAQAVGAAAERKAAASRAEHAARAATVARARRRR